MRLARTAVWAVLLGAAMFLGATRDTSSQTPAPKVRNLMQAPLAEEFTPGREVLIDLVEIPPDTALDRHWHPGEEFHYYLEGDVEIQIEGQASIVGTAGSVGHVPFKKRHRAVAGKKGAKVLVFRVHTKGQPWRYVDDDD